MPQFSLITIKHINLLSFNSGLRENINLLSPPVPICDETGNGAGVSIFSPELDRMAPLNRRSRLRATSARADADLSVSDDVDEWRDDLEDKKLFLIVLNRFGPILI